MVPTDLLYTKTHEWIRVRDDLAIVGITDFAQSELGDIVAIDLPDPGARVVSGEPFGSVDSVKAVSELISPVSGEVVRRNDDLMDAPEKVNESPYDEGWLIEIRLSDASELDGLMKVDEYEALIG
jgi:glycine cleavage system H protein